MKQGRTMLLSQNSSCLACLTFPGDFDMGFTVEKLRQPMGGRPGALGSADRSGNFASYPSPVLEGIPLYILLIGFSKNIPNSN